MGPTKAYICNLRLSHFAGSYCAMGLTVTFMWNLRLSHFTSSYCAMVHTEAYNE